MQPGMEQSIGCPKCDGKITFDTAALLSGESFACETCGANIALSRDTRSEVQDAVDLFERAKKTI